MKKIVTLFVFTLFVVGGVLAQQKQKPRQSPEERARIQTEILDNNLELSEEQKKKAYKIFLSYGQPVAMLERASSKAEVQAFFEKRMAQKDADIRAILTEEQQKTYDELRRLTEERKQKEKEEKAAQENQEQQEQVDKQQ